VATLFAEAVVARASMILVRMNIICIFDGGDVEGRKNRYLENCI